MLAYFFLKTEFVPTNYPMEENESSISTFFLICISILQRKVMLLQESLKTLGFTQSDHVFLPSNRILRTHSSSVLAPVLCSGQAPSFSLHPLAFHWDTAVPKNSIMGGITIKLFGNVEKSWLEVICTDIHI